MPRTTSTGLIVPAKGDLIRVAIYLWKGQRRWRSMKPDETAQSIRDNLHRNASPMCRLEAIVRCYWNGEVPLGFSLSPLGRIAATEIGD